MASLQLQLFNCVPTPSTPDSMEELNDYAERVPHYLQEYQGTVHQAIRNFLGVLLFHTKGPRDPLHSKGPQDLFHTKGPQEALDCFNEILKDDDENLNALQNCEHVCKELDRTSQAKEYEDRRQELLVSSNPRKPLLLARLHAEVGYVMAYEFSCDPQNEIDDYERLIEATKYFEKALKVPELFTEVELCQWHFFGGRAHTRLYDRLLKRQPDHIKPIWDTTIKRCVEHFNYVIQNADTFTTQNADTVTYIAGAWCFLGVLFSKMPMSQKKRNATFIKKHKLDDGLADPGICFLNARHLCPQNAEFVCRHGRLFKSRGDFEAAIRLFDLSIEKDKTKANWLAFSSRGVSRKNLYRKQHQQWAKAKRTRDRKNKPGLRNIQPSMQLLELAEQDLEKSLELKPIVRERIDLIEVCHMLGKLDRAVFHFRQAGHSLKGTGHLPLYLNLGNYLRDKREVDDAIAAYKTALDCVDGKEFSFQNAFQNLTELTLLQCGKSNLSEKLVRETADIFDSGFIQYNRGSSIRSHIRGCCRHDKFPCEMFQVCMDLFAREKHDTVRVALPELTRAFEHIVQCSRRSDHTKAKQGKHSKTKQNKQFQSEITFNMTDIEENLQTVRRISETLSQVDVRHEAVEAVTEPKQGSLGEKTDEARCLSGRDDHDDDDDDDGDDDDDDDDNGHDGGDKDEDDLCLKLDTYYKDYVDINLSAMSDAQQVVDEVVYLLQDHFKRTWPRWHIGTLKQVGSTVEGLKVIKPDEFDIMIPINIDPSHWELVDAGVDAAVTGADTDYASPGFWLLKVSDRKKIHYFSTPFDSYVLDGFLSPAKMRDAFQGALQKMINPKRTRYVFKSSMHGPSATLTVEYAQNHSKTLSIDLVPTVSIQNVLGQEQVDIVAKPHPLTLQGQQKYALLWRRSFSTKESQQLAKATTSQTKCLKILKAIRENDKTLRVFSSYIFKTVLLHEAGKTNTATELSDDGDLSQQFVHLVKSLISYMERLCLPHFFSPDVNVLVDYDSSTLLGVQSYLEKTIRGKALGRLLKFN